MNERYVRRCVALVLILGQLVSLLVVMVLTAADRFTPSEMFAALGIVGPLFAAYTTTAVRRLLGQAVVERARQVSGERAFIAILLPAVFVLLIFLVILWKAFGSLIFDDLLKLIGVLQTLLGVYIGYVAESVLLGKRLEVTDLPPLAKSPTQQ